MEKESPPARGRGLKRHAVILLVRIKQVAPRAGAWIETPPSRCIAEFTAVAPRAGAWIETLHLS